MSDGDRRREGERESRRIIGRVSDEGSALGMRMKSRAKDWRDHVTAADANQEDWVEVWGRRIGRTVGVAVLFGLAVYFLLYGV